MSETTIEAATTGIRTDPASGGLGLGLVLMWCRDEPLRVGEVAIIGPGELPWILGRGDEARPRTRRARLVRQRPGDNEVTAPLSSRRISREQLRLECLATGRLSVEKLGGGEMRIRGRSVAQATLRPGELLELPGRLLMLCVERPPILPASRSWPAAPLHPFGRADAFGMVGESPAMWALRERLAFVAEHAGHVLVRGPVGCGKELAARAIHALSACAGAEILTRSAAALEGEAGRVALFGSGDAPGLLEAAGGGVLLLDGVETLSGAIQQRLAHALENGRAAREGQVDERELGLRFVAVQGAGRGDLEPSFAARFRHLIETPPLSDRVEDLPLLLHHLLDQAGREDPELAARFLSEAPEGDAPLPGPRLELQLVSELARAPLPMQVRSLESALWEAVAASPGTRLGWHAQVSGSRAAAAAMGEADSGPRQGRSDPDALEQLSPTERRVLRHLTQNKTSKEIAAELFVSPRTVQNHRASICRKLELRGANALLEFALSLRDI